jgi:hypothetical protein
LPREILAQGLVVVHLKAFSIAACGAIAQPFALLSNEALTD